MACDTHFLYDQTHAIRELNGNVTNANDITCVAVTQSNCPICLLVSRCGGKYIAALPLFFTLAAIEVSDGFMSFPALTVKLSYRLLSSSIRTETLKLVTALSPAVANHVFDTGIVSDPVEVDAAYSSVLL